MQSKKESLVQDFIKKLRSRYGKEDLKETNKENSSFSKNKYKIEREPGKWLDNLKDKAKTDPQQVTISTFKKTSDPKLNIRQSTRYYRSQDSHSVRVVTKTKKNNIVTNKISVSNEPYRYGLNLPFFSELGIKKLDENKKTEKSRSVGVSRDSEPLKLLTDRILNHKVKYVKQITGNLSEINQENGPFQINLNQLDTQYPALIIKLNNAYPEHAKMLNGNEKDYNGAYTELLTQLLIASINKRLCEEGFGASLDRRQSFGFLTPTCTDVHGAIRLSFGLVPNSQWSKAVEDGVRDCNHLIDQLWQDKFVNNTNRWPPIQYFKEDSILKTTAHKLILEMMLKHDPGVMNANLVRVLNGLFEGEVFVNLGSIASKELDIMGQLGDKNKIRTQVLNYESENWFRDLQLEIQERTTQAKMLNKGQNDDEFKNLYDWIIEIYESLLQSPEDEKLIHSDYIEQIEYLSNLSNSYLLKSIDTVSHLNEISESSDSEDSSEENQIIHKAYTPSGMSALYNPLLAFCYAKGGRNNNITCKIMPYAYFELNEWHSSTDEQNIQVIINNETENIKVLPVESKVPSEIVFLDNNPCVNTDVTPIRVLDMLKEYEEKQDKVPKLMIVDVTSSTEEQKKSIVEAFQKTTIPLLVFASSGLKNKQLGFDKAQYGEDRLIINKKQNKTDKFIIDFKKQFTNLLQGSSSVYPTTIRRELRTTTKEVSNRIYRPLSETINQILNNQNNEDIAPIIHNLIDDGIINLNAQDKYGYTLLHALVCKASETKNNEELLILIQQLINKGASVNLPNVDNVTPLQIAQQGQNEDLIRALTETDENFRPVF